MNDTPRLEALFNTAPYHDSEVADILLNLRFRGFAKLPNVLNRIEAEKLAQLIRSRAIKRDHEGRWTLPDDIDEFVWPCLAPRAQQVARLALSSSKHAAQVSIFEIVWKITDHHFQQPWHKDRQHEGMPGNEYHYPSCIHVSMYFDDIQPDDGPTELIPNSHQNQALNPISGSPKELVLIRTEDAVIWDQRCWHRASKRASAGLRILSLVGYVPVQLFGNSPQREMPKAMVRAWKNAKSDSEAVLIGGRWSLKSILENR
jgi:hypothetical protein